MKMAFDEDATLTLRRSASLYMDDGSQLDVMEGFGEERVDGLGRALKDGESFTVDSGVVFLRWGQHCLYLTSVEVQKEIEARWAARDAERAAEFEGA